MYEQLREADATQEIKVIQKLRSIQAHCVKFHHGRLATIVRSLFNESEDELTKTVKKIVFDVDDGNTILSSYHPVMIELAKLSSPSSRHRQARDFRG